MLKVATTEGQEAFIDRAVRTVEEILAGREAE